MPLLANWYLWSLVVHALNRSRPHNKHIPIPKLYTGKPTTSGHMQGISPHAYGSAFCILLIIFSIGLLSSWMTIQMVRENWQTGHDLTEWSFGQIVAVTVWLPSLLSFINDCIYGPLRGRSAQLPEPLSIVRTTSIYHDLLPASAMSLPPTSIQSADTKNLQ